MFGYPMASVLSENYKKEEISPTTINCFDHSDRTYYFYNIMKSKITSIVIIVATFLVTLGIIVSNTEQTILH